MSDFDFVQRGTVLQDGRVYNTTQQDATAIYEQAQRDRIDEPETGRYKKNLVKAASIPFVDVEKMANGQCCPDKGAYNLLSPDREERRRALVHYQSYHGAGMCTNGKVFTMHRPKWE